MWKKCISKKCLTYHSRTLKKSEHEAIECTYKYVNEYYNKVRCNINKKKISANEKTTNISYLINRFEDLDNIHKNHMGIKTSAIISFIISLGFAILSISFDNPSGNYFETVNGSFEMFGAAFHELVEQNILLFILVFLSFIIFGCIMISPIIMLLFGSELGAKLLYFSDVTYRVFIIPYERKKIIETLGSYNDGYKCIE